jgi:hypothetical protein
MNEVGPMFRCAVCNRGVLNRAVAHCLYCGADLPEEVRLAPEAIARRDAEHARKEAELAHLKLVPPVQPERSKVLDVIDGVSAGVEVFGLLGDLLS